MASPPLYSDHNVSHDKTQPLGSEKNSVAVLTTKWCEDSGNPDDPRPADKATADALSWDEAQGTEQLQGTYIQASPVQGPKEGEGHIIDLQPSISLPRIDVDKSASSSVVAADAPAAGLSVDEEKCKSNTRSPFSLDGGGKFLSEWGSANDDLRARCASKSPEVSNKSAPLVFEGPCASPEEGHAFCGVQADADVNARLTDATYATKDADVTSYGQIDSPGIHGSTDADTVTCGVGGGTKPMAGSRDISPDHCFDTAREMCGNVVQVAQGALPLVSKGRKRRRTVQFDVRPRRWTQRKVAPKNSHDVDPVTPTGDREGYASLTNTVTPIAGCVSEEEEGVSQGGAEERSTQLDTGASSANANAARPTLNHAGVNIASLLMESSDPPPSYHRRLRRVRRRPVVQEDHPVFVEHRTLWQLQGSRLFYKAPFATEEDVLSSLTEWNDSPALVYAGLLWKYTPKAILELAVSPGPKGNILHKEEAHGK